MTCSSTIHVDSCSVIDNQTHKCVDCASGYRLFIFIFESQDLSQCLPNSEFMDDNIVGDNV